jgi:hypothetical protein
VPVKVEVEDVSSAWLGGEQWYAYQSRDEVQTRGRQQLVRNYAG